MGKQKVSLDGKLPLSDFKDLVRMLKGSGCTKNRVREIIYVNSKSLSNQKTIQALRNYEISIYGFIAPEGANQQLEYELGH